MNGESWTVNSDNSEIAYIAQVKKWRAEHGYLTFPKPRIGKDRSLDMNALFHVWATEYAAFLLNKGIKQVTKGELAGMKRIIKKRFNANHGNDFMVHDVVDPYTGKSKRDYTSSSDWKQGEMFMVMEWLQFYAANDGLILESKGKHRQLKKQSEGQ